MSDLSYRELSAIVRLREKYLCAACGRDTRHMAWWSIQHRVARGQGGRNELANMILLCGSATSNHCHWMCEQRRRDMHERGFWLNSWEDPATFPVVLWTGHRVILTPNGRYKPADCPPGSVSHDNPLHTPPDYPDRSTPGDDPPPSLPLDLPPAASPGI